MNESAQPEPNTMTEAYWDQVATHYERHVLSVFDHDRSGVVMRQLRALASDMAGDARAADLGCGVGKYTAALAERFSHVEACDISAKSLEVAREAGVRDTNVTLRRLDFTSEPAPFEPVDLVLCVNVLIMAPLDERLRAWRFVVNQVAHGGVLLLVVPSLESALYLDYRSVEWGLRDGLSCADAVSEALVERGSLGDLHLGVRPIDGMATKHYLRDELEFMLVDRGFEVSASERVEYNWSAFFTDLPENTPGPRPWDWMITAQRVDADS